MATSTDDRGAASFVGLTTLVRAIERLHASGEVGRRSGVDLERALHPVVFVIGDRGVARINDLANDLGLEPSTVSRHVTKLVERGLVVRATDGKDRRASAVRLTAAGRATRDRLRRTWQSMLADAADEAGVDERNFGASFAAVARGMVALLDPSTDTARQPSATR